MQGVSSLCRFWLMETSGYYTLLHFFRSSAWDLGSLLEVWYSWVISQGHSHCSQKRLAVIGDHTYVTKDGRRTPGVVTLHQTSESQSKPSYFKGQCWGALGLLIGGRLTPFALPLCFQMHQGWIHLGQDSKENSLTLAEAIVQMAIDFAWKVQKPVVLTLDAFFSVQSVFRLAESIYWIPLKAPLVTIIVRAKKNYVAYFQADRDEYSGRGRPRTYGESIHLMEVFDSLHIFEEGTARIYGRTETFRWCMMDLLWKPTGGLIRFVFALTSRGPIILMCSNLMQDPIAAVELYCLRTRIETMFDLFKNVVHGFQCHFWSQKMKKHSRSPESNKMLKPPKKEDLQTVQACWEAYERFVMVAAIALGLLQLSSLTFSNRIWKHYQGFLRTQSRSVPSERTTKNLMATLLVQDLISLAPSATMREIRAKVLKEQIQDQGVKNRKTQEKEAA